MKSRAKSLVTGKSALADALRIMASDLEQGRVVQSAEADAVDPQDAARLARATRQVEAALAKYMARRELLQRNAGIRLDVAILNEDGVPKASAEKGTAVHPYPQLEEHRADGIIEYIDAETAIERVAAKSGLSPAQVQKIVYPSARKRRRLPRKAK